jgi:ABC-type branched-subunit amino acid transport system ATPase component
MKKILEIKNLDKSFGGVHAINDLSFDIYEGEILGLIGPNGCGKSTTVNLITGVYIQDSGEILFDGKSLKKELVPDRAAMGLARTFQTPKPFSNMTVFDSVYTVCMLYNKSMKAAAKRAHELLELTGFTEQADTLCSKLPIEKRKWLDMTRALATNPKILMLDECLAGLTPSEIEDSIEMVKKINATGITILFIEHVMSAVVNLCTRVVVMESGHFLSEGDPQVVMRQPEVIKAYLGEDYENA